MLCMSLDSHSRGQRSGVGCPYHWKLWVHAAQQQVVEALVGGMTVSLSTIYKRETQEPRIIIQRRLDIWLTYLVAFALSPLEPYRLLYVDWKYPQVALQKVAEGETCGNKMIFECWIRLFQPDV